MSEKTLLQEIEKDQQKEIERKLSEIKKQSKLLSDEKEQKQRETRKDVFSSASFPADEVEKLKQKYAKPQPTEEQEINKIESKVAQVIEKPNYDYMETLSEKQRKKIFVVKKDKVATEAKPRRNRLKFAIISILFAIFGTWSIVNITTIDSVSSQIAEVSSVYKLNLFTYLRNLTSLDAANSKNMENLFETIPDQENVSNSIEKESNWFDRFCNFLGGLFGG